MIPAPQLWWMPRTIFIVYRGLGRKYMAKAPGGQRYCEIEKLKIAGGKMIKQNIKAFRWGIYTFGIAVVFFSMTIKGQAQSLTIGTPGTRTVAALDAVSGSVTGRVARVRISIGKQESDEVWNCNQVKPGSKNVVCAWSTGPTGQWLDGRISGTSWTTFLSKRNYLPSGPDLPNGSYVIHVYGTDAAGATVVEQISRTFTVRH